MTGAYDVGGVCAIVDNIMAERCATTSSLPTAFAPRSVSLELTIIK